jgi:hypothetical protein
MSGGKHLDEERWAAQKRAANRARHRATMRLRKRYASDWAELYEEECLREGVTPRLEMQAHVRGKDGRGGDRRG